MAAELHLDEKKMVMTLALKMLDVASDRSLRSALYPTA
jgi:hypothetical protein